MAQLLLIKDANTSAKTVGDIVGIYEDTHRFSEEELNYYSVQKIVGTRTEVIEKFNTLSPGRAHVYKAETTAWTKTEPEHKQVWFNADDKKWYFLEKQPKYPFTLSTLTEAEKTNLELRVENTELEKIVVKFDDNELNKVEAVDLNIVVVADTRSLG